MNIQTVGQENLPNVFIEEITIYPTTDVLNPDKDHRIVVRLAMYDHARTPSWRRQGMSDVKVKIAFVTDNTRNALNNGEASLYDFNFSTQQLVIGNRVRIVGIQELVRSGGTDDFHRYVKNVEVTMDKPQNLNVYAACYIDDLDLGSDLLNKFYGPMVGEKVYIGGELNDQSGYFYSPETNEEYGGPVHAAGNSYMEGSEHSDSPHMNLRYVVEENYKIRFVSGITDPNELLPEEPGPQSGASNARRQEALGAIQPGTMSTVPLDQLLELPENVPGGNFNPDGTGGY